MWSSISLVLNRSIEWLVESFAGRLLFSSIEAWLDVFDNAILNSVNVIPEYLPPLFGCLLQEILDSLLDRLVIVFFPFLKVYLFGFVD